MNDPTNTDWNRLVRKTRRRPLMFDPNAVQTAEGTKVRPRLLISALMACATVGGFFTGITFYIPELWAKAVTFVGIKHQRSPAGLADEPIPVCVGRIVHDGLLT